MVMCEVTKTLAYMLNFVNSVQTVTFPLGSMGKAVTSC